MNKNGVFHASNQVGNFDYENQRFSILVFSILLLLDFILTDDKYCYVY
jgi:hypothetical protein